MRSASGDIARDALPATRRSGTPTPAAARTMVMRVLLELVLAVVTVMSLALVLIVAVLTVVALPLVLIYALAARGRRWRVR